MSHFKEYKTNIDNLEYLKLVLERINISYSISGQNILLTQVETKNCSFQWNGKNYSFIYDIDLWDHFLTINSFIENITTEYCAEKIVNTMTKFGYIINSYKIAPTSDQFQTIKEKELILSRYFL